MYDISARRLPSRETLVPASTPFVTGTFATRNSCVGAASRSSAAASSFAGAGRPISLAAARSRFSSDCLISGALSAGRMVHVKAFARHATILRGTAA